MFWVSGITTRVKSSPEPVPRPAVEADVHRIRSGSVTVTCKDGDVLTPVALSAGCTRVGIAGAWLTAVPLTATVTWWRGWCG